MRQLVVLDLVTDLSIGLACAAIAFALIHFARRPTGLPYARVFVAFAVFIIADGATHLAAVWSVWQPSAWLATLLRVVTALASVAVALVLPPLINISRYQHRISASLAASLGHFRDRHGLTSGAPTNGVRGNLCCWIMDACHGVHLPMSQSLLMSDWTCTANVVGFSSEALIR